MKKRYIAPLTIAAFGLMAVFATSAFAHASYTELCTHCHTPNAAVTIGAVAGVAGATTTSYTVSAANSLGSVGWAVFNGSAKVAGGSGSHSTVGLTNGVTYSVIGAGTDGSGNTYGKSISVTPPVPDVTPPNTTSDAKATYLNSATIHLTPTDNVGGSGVAHTYFILDSGLQTEGTTVSTSTVGAHTLEFWSVDASGNVETPHKTAAFSLTLPVPDTTPPTTTSDAQANYFGSATIHLSATDNVGGSGVAHTYFILDSGLQTEGTTGATSLLGTHTVEFWSVDTSGNVETPHNTAQFTVSVNPAPVLYTFSYKFNLKKTVYSKLKAILKSNATGRKYTVTISRKGLATWRNLPRGTYRLSTTGNARFKFKARTVKVGL